MIEVIGTYNTARVYTKELEEAAARQIEALCNMEYAAGETIRIMPDVHAGAGCTIGTTMTIRDRIAPNLVGVDIGCGMETVRIKEKHMELGKLDKLIYQKIPSGFHIRKEAHRYSQELELGTLRCSKHVNLLRAERSIGTLGGGNHFIEVSKDEEGNLYLVIHSGGRHLGLETAQYYQQKGWEQMGQPEEIPRALACVSGTFFEDYIHDMKLVQQFAVLNRKAMMDEILRGMKLTVEEEFTTIHNYIDTDEMLLRKGAVSAKEGEMLLVPMNMRDGSLICKGRGNPDWNCSAPHGAGRLMSRTRAKETFTLGEFKKEMEGIFTTSVNKGTIDECPMAYKDMDEIMEQIEPTADVVKVIRPIYNFKAAGK